MSQKYNPDYHSSVVRNMRQLWAQSRQNSELTLTDEQIWNVFNENYGVELIGFDAEVKEFGMEDAAYLVGLKEAMENVS